MKLGIWHIAYGTSHRKKKVPDSPFIVNLSHGHGIGKSLWSAHGKGSDRPLVK